MARASRGTRATIWTATAGMALTAALLPHPAAAQQVTEPDSYLTGPSSQDAERITRDYLAAHPDTYPRSAELRLRKQYTDVAGIRHLSFVQYTDGVPVFGDGVKANVARDGRLISVLGAPVTGLPSALAPARISGAQARAEAVEDVTDAEPQPKAGPQDSVKQVAYATPGGAVRAWRTVTAADGGDMWLHVVDASDGRVLYRQNLTSDLAARPTHTSQQASGQPESEHTSGHTKSATGKAEVWDNYPGAEHGGKQTTRHLTARGWLPPGATTLNGPIAHVFADADGDDKPGAGEEIQAAPDGTFSYPFKTFDGPNCGTPLPCSWDAQTPYSWQANREQNAAQVYYLLGKFHDHLEAAPIGFTRAAGNFDGRDGDAVQAATDSGAAVKAGLPDDAHLNNANMSTPPDGQAPLMRLYLSAPFRKYQDILQGNHGDDASVVYHEYTHGLSNRLVTDADGVSTLKRRQARSMGEAWSDWYALDFLAAEGLKPDRPGVDGDLTYDNPGWLTGYEARTQGVDCPVGSTSPACPGTPGAGPGGYTYGDFGKIYAKGPETHADGEIWSETLWDLRAKLGSGTTESLVTRAMELSPADPTFLDQRNAILQADTVVNDGRNRAAIWEVFAHRGMGWFAAALNGDDTRPDEDFSLPPGPDTPVHDLTGTVTDSTTGTPAAGVTVSLAGHNSGFPGADRTAVTKADGTYVIPGVPAGTYRKVSASGAGFEPEARTVTVGSGAVDWRLRRDWAAKAGGAEVSDFSGDDYGYLGCGPDALLDQGVTSWGSGYTGGVNGQGVDPIHVTVKLPGAVDVSEARIDPTAGCGDDITASLGQFRLETSPDGTTWSTAAEGRFTPADDHRENAVPLRPGTGDAVRYVRLVALGNQAVDNGVDCAKDATPAGCAFVDAAELAVNGEPHIG